VFVASFALPIPRYARVISLPCCLIVNLSFQG
jgi:hypothetical protein